MPPLQALHLFRSLPETLDSIVESGEFGRSEALSSVLEQLHITWPSHVHLSMSVEIYLCTDSNTLCHSAQSVEAIW